MSALKHQRTPKRASHRSLPLMLASGERATQGGMACLDPSVNAARSGADGNTNLLRVGVWAQTVDNTAGSTARPALCDLDFELFGHWFDNDSVSPVTALYGLAYILDDHSVTASSASDTRAVAGRVWNIAGNGSTVFVETTALDQIGGGEPGPPGPGAGAFTAFTYATHSPSVLQTLPAGKLVARVALVITTPFDVPATIEVGTFADPGLFFEPGDITGESAISFDDDELYPSSSPDSLILTLSAPGATQGAGVVYYQVL